jgi:hypothetical protein
VRAAAVGAQIRVTPAIGHPKTAFAISFLAPQSSGSVNGTHRAYEVDATIPTTPGSHCQASFNAPVSEALAGVRAKVFVRPSSSWCLGFYAGRIVETVTPVCAAGQACPQYILLRPVGTFKLQVGPACTIPTVPLPAHEPQLRVGPTELISGLYVQGGPFIPGCKQEPRGPFAGTLTATSVGTTTERMTVRETLHKNGKLFVLSLVPGTYTLVATDTGGLRVAPQTVTIPQNRTVRQDVFVDVP